MREREKEAAAAIEAAKQTLKDVRAERRRLQRKQCARCAVINEMGPDGCSDLEIEGCTRCYGYFCDVCFAKSDGCEQQLCERCHDRRYGGAVSDSD